MTPSLTAAMTALSDFAVISPAVLYLAVEEREEMSDQSDLTAACASPPFYRVYSLSATSKAAAVALAASSELVAAGALMMYVFTMLCERHCQSETVFRLPSSYAARPHDAGDEKNYEDWRVEFGSAILLGRHKAPRPIVLGDSDGMNSTCQET